MEVDHDLLQEHIEALEFLVEDMPLKARDELEKVVNNLKNSPDVEKLIKIQDELETISNMNNVDSYTRNEIMNIIADLEQFINS